MIFRSWVEMRYANGIQPPTQTVEHYGGNIAKVSIDALDRITVELRAYTATCCSHPFTATLSADRQSLAGQFGSPVQTKRQQRWSRSECQPIPASLPLTLETH